MIQMNHQTRTAGSERARKKNLSNQRKRSMYVYSVTG